ncbi:SPFH domain-containing protein [Streptomyces sp. NPDC090021]|uniref:SPFH domain-containing protein n=1 Tax=Streptomyces sp. NPDC090021 TaxID=3365919 RepID=UPI00380102E5
MFPTRTTSTTGTLRVPAATAAAATSFGWAAATPTLSLRVAAPEPAGEAGRRPEPSTAAEPREAAPAPAPAPATVPAPAAAPHDEPTPADAGAPRYGAPVAAAAVPPVPSAVPAVPAVLAEPIMAAPGAAARASAFPAPADGAAPAAHPVARASAPEQATVHGEREPASTGVVGRTAAVPAPHPVRDEPGTASPSAPLGTYPRPSAAEAPPTRRNTTACPAAGPAPHRATAAGPAAAPAPQSVPVAPGPAPHAGRGAGVVPVSGRPAVSAGQAPLREADKEGVPASGPVAGQVSLHAAGVAQEVPAGPVSRPEAGSVLQSATGEGVAVPAPDAVSVPTGRVAGAGPAAVPLPVAGPVSRPEAGSVPQSATGERVAVPAPDAVPVPTGRVAGAGSPPASAEAVVPAAREAAEAEPGLGPGGPDPQRDEPGAARSGVPGPGPGVAEIVARAVARAMDEDDTQDLPNVAAPRRGSAVTEVPPHLPFRAASTIPLPERAPAAAPRPARPAPGRRVPRGDDRLREHRGPVLPGWVGVAVGGLALTGCAAVLWRAGILPAPLVAAFGAAPRAYQGLHATHWPPLAFLGIVVLVALGGLGRARTGHAWVLTLFGRYRGTVRRTGLTWVSPLLLRRRVDVRLRHWRSDPMPAVDSGGLALQVVVQVVWQVKDTARATLAVADHTEYLAEQVESAMARVLSQLPADAFHEDAPTLRDAEAVGDALTRMLAAETEAVGIEVFSAQPTRIEYAAEVAEAMRRRRVAAIDAKHRDAVLTSVVDAVDDTVHRLTSRGLVELDDYERKALVKDLTVAFYTGRTE